MFYPLDRQNTIYEYNTNNQSDIVIFWIVWSKWLSKVSQFHNEFTKSSFLPKYEQKIVKISAQGETMTS